MSDICGDNRFEIIAEAKSDLLEATNIKDSPEEMAALDSFLFRCWQMGWLGKYQLNEFEWCTDCKEYDHEKHCCPRFNRVIRDTLNEVKPMRKRGTWMHDKDDVLISGYCSCCGWESIIMETDVADMPFCPNCGADMRGEQDE